jgi:hypothetical protein
MNPNNPLQQEVVEKKPQEKRAWHSPEIVDVGGVLDLTEAVTENVNDSRSGSMQVTYRP